MQDVTQRDVFEAKFSVKARIMLLKHVLPAYSC